MLKPEALVGYYVHCPKVDPPATNNLVPQSLVPESDLVVGQVRSLGVEIGGVEDNVLLALAVQGPLKLVIGPLGVGVASQDKGHEVLLHLDSSRGVHSARHLSRLDGAALGGGRVGGGRAGQSVSAVPVVALVSTVSGRVDLNHAVPGLVVEGVGEGHVVGGQVKVLLHVAEAQTRAVVVILGVESQDRVDLGIGNGREENLQVGRDILSGVDTVVGLAVGLVLLVGNDSRAGKVESVLVELGLVGIGDKVTIDTGLHLEGVVANNRVGSILEGVKVNGTQAGQVAALTADSGGDVLEEGLGVLVAGAGDEAGGHDIGLGVELLGVAGETGHLEERLGSSSRETHGGDGVGVSSKVANVLVDPLQGVLNIPQGDVAGAVLVEQGWAICKASHAETVVV